MADDGPHGSDQQEGDGAPPGGPAGKARGALRTFTRRARGGAQRVAGWGRGAAVGAVRAGRERRAAGALVAPSADLRKRMAKYEEEPLEVWQLAEVLGYAPAAFTVLVAVVWLLGGVIFVPVVLSLLVGAFCRSQVGVRGDRRLGRDFRARVLRIGIFYLLIAVMLGVLHVTVFGHSALGPVFVLMSGVHSALVWAEWRSERLASGHLLFVRVVGFLDSDDQELEYTKLTTTRVIAPAWMRMLGLGLVRFDSAAEEALVGFFGPVRRPQDVRAAILRRKRAVTLGTERPAGNGSPTPDSDV